MTNMVKNSESRKRFYFKNRYIICKRQKEYYNKHKDTINANRRKKYILNRDQMLGQRKIEYNKYKDIINVNRRKKYILNREYMLEQRKIAYQKYKYDISRRQKEKHLLNREQDNFNKRRSYYKHREKALIRGKKYYQKNKDMITVKINEYRKNNKDKYLIRQREYYYKHRARIIAMNVLYAKARKSEDTTYHLMHSVRNRIWYALNAHLDGGKVKSSKLYGIDTNLIAQKLMNELPKDFEFGKYHVDHIIPIACFDLNDPEQLKECFAPENHQWLLAQDNLKKSDKILEQHLPIYNRIKERLNIR